MAVVDGVNITTLLVITGMGVPPYSARGLMQTLDPIAASIHLERSVDGGLLDFSAPQMRKYASKITCTDQDAPAFGGIWPGTRVTVECVKELSFLTAHPELQERPEVPGSIRIQGDFTFYRPILEMVVRNPSGSYREWAAEEIWSLELEEA